MDLLAELFSGRNAGITGTALGLFEAATSWDEHVRTAESQESRFKRSLLKPRSFRATAHTLALEAAAI